MPWFSKLLVVLVLYMFCSLSAGYRKAALRQHNDLRAIHNAPAMKLNDNLNYEADKYAKQLFQRFGGTGRLKHSPRDSRKGQGENLASGCTTARGRDGRTVEDAAKSWYDEVCKYNFNIHGYQEKLGHFSQLVWKDSTELGIGKFTGRSGKWTCTYIVARYKPAGNVDVASYFKENVSRGSFRASYCDNVMQTSIGDDEYLDAPVEFY